MNDVKLSILPDLIGHSGQVTSVIFSPDGNAIASSSYDKTINLWDISTGNLISRFKGHSDWVTRVSFCQTKH